MTDRRRFLGALGFAALAMPVFPTRRRRIEVQASTSVFFGRRPDGLETLVRFVVHEVDQPAGRMRVYDGQRRLLGTAGVIGQGGRLYGELWLPLGANTRVTSELEMPGLRAPHRTQHTLSPPRQWTIHWITAIDPAALERTLDALPEWQRAAAIATLRAEHVTGNPLSDGPEASVPLLDHLPFLRTALRAGQLERRFGIPVSPVAVAGAPVMRMRSASLLLNGTNASYAVLDEDLADGRPFWVLVNQGDARVITVSRGVGNRPVTLGFAAGGEPMARAIEDWLTSSPHFISPAYDTDVALVVSTDREADRTTMMAAVDEWNRLYAFPRIVVGNPDAFFRAVEPLAMAATDGGRSMPPRPHPEAAPGASDIAAAARARQHDRNQRTEQIVGPVAELAGAPGGLDQFASQLSFGFPGHLVFNPSPVGRSDRVVFPDGSEHWVTNVPPLGYVYVPSGSDSLIFEAVGAGHTVMGERHTIGLDRTSGAIASLFDRHESREWVGPGGFNAVAGSRLLDVTRRHARGVGEQIVARRSTPFGPLTSTITAHESNPWITVENDLDASGNVVVRYESTMAHGVETVTWETPAGFERAEAPAGMIAHLRWLGIDDAQGWRLLIRGLDTPWMLVDGATLTSYAPAGQTGYRLGTARPEALLDEPWHFGWSGEPFVAVEAPGNGPHPIPTYGRVIEVGGGAMLLGLKLSDAGFGAIAYLQNVYDVDLQVRLSPGLLRFGRAELTDLVERDIGVTLPLDGGHVAVPISAHGVSVVRLTDLSFDTNP